MSTETEKPKNLFEKVINAFAEHPRDAGETYLEHLIFTIGMAGRFVYIGIVIAIHGIFPFLLTHTASNGIDKAHQILQARAEKCRESKQAMNS
jgi:hypothetical protein